MRSLQKSTGLSFEATRKLYENRQGIIDGKGIGGQKTEEYLKGVLEEDLGEGEYRVSGTDSIWVRCRVRVRGAAKNITAAHSSGWNGSNFCGVLSNTEQALQPLLEEDPLPPSVRKIP